MTVFPHRASDIDGPIPVCRFQSPSVSASSCNHGRVCKQTSRAASQYDIKVRQAAIVIDCMNVGHIPFTFAKGEGYPETSLTFVIPSLSIDLQTAGLILSHESGQFLTRTYVSVLQNQSSSC